MIYLDHAASTPLSSKGYDSLVAALPHDMASPVAAHRVGQQLMSVIDSARGSWLKALGVEEGYHCVFTGSATESNNLMIAGVSLKDGDEIIYSEGDHPSTVLPVRQRLESGATGVPLPFSHCGDIDVPALLKVVGLRTRLLILNAVNGQTGHCYDVMSMARDIKAIFPGVLIHVDGAQAIGKIPFSLKGGCIDSLSISGHKLGGPKGCSALIFKSSIKIKPLLLGGGQEFGLRPSTQSMPLIQSFTAAGLDALDHLSPSYDKVHRLQSILVDGLRDRLPEVQFPFEQSSKMSPYLVMMVFAGIPGEVLMRTLEDKGIVVSTRSACSSKQHQEIPIFTLLGIEHSLHACTLRVSFSRETTQEDVNAFLVAVESSVNELKLFYSK